MDATQQLKYYSNQIIKLMNQYETNTKTLMSETQSDLEKACWNAIDEKDLIRVKALHSRLCKVVDNSNDLFNNFEQFINKK